MLLMLTHGINNPRQKQADTAHRIKRLVKGAIRLICRKNSALSGIVKIADDRDIPRDACIPFQSLDPTEPFRHFFGWLGNPSLISG